MSGGVKGFLGYSLACDTLPDWVVVDCLFIIGMKVASEREPKDLVAKNLGLELRRCFEQLLTDNEIIRSFHLSMIFSTW